MIHNIILLLAAACVFLLAAQELLMPLPACALFLGCTV